MKTPKHTPGPWMVDPDCPTDVMTDGVDKLMWIVLQSDDIDRSNKSGMLERESNARLISASPDLFEAATDALDLLDFIMKGEDPCPQQIKLRAAINKVLGGAE